MNNCWQKTALVLTTIFGAFEAQPLYATSSNVILNEVQTLKDKSIPLFAQQNRVCLRLATKYSKIYAFETQRFCISIYRVGDKYFYLRQSKANPEELLMLPANAVFGGTIFQAIDGKTIYFVGIDANGYYSSVMQNDDEVVFEPEIQPPLVDLPNNSGSKQTLTENIPFLTDSSDEPLENMDDFQQKTDWEICTQEEQTNPLINSWQKLIGTSIKTANDCEIPVQFN